LRDLLSRVIDRDIAKGINTQFNRLRHLSALSYTFSQCSPAQSRSS
jgi:hypothetical protein